MLTIAVGRINDPAQAEEILKSNKADMVVIGRAQLADPEFCNKVKENRVDEIVRCVGCNQECYDGFVSPDVPFITCMRNPVLGREAEATLTLTSSPKKVLVAGGGIAGLEAAMVLKQRGHNPVVYEATNNLGGQFVLAGEAPRKEEMKEAAISAGEQAQKAGIDIKLNTPVTVDIINKEQPDEVIISIGATPLKLNVPGADLPHVANSHDVLSGKVKVNGNVVVIGGGLVGLEVAEYVHGEATDITVVEMLDQVAKDLGDLRKICVMENLAEFGIKTLTNSKCLEIKEKSIVVDNNGTSEEILCDYVVVAIGAKSRDFSEIKNYCDTNNISYHIVGDALRARRALNAVAEANEIARSI